MSMFHNTLKAEKVALLWHWFGASVSAAMALIHGTITAVLAHGDFTKTLAIVAVIGHEIAVVICLAGLGWHLWAVKQHTRHIKELEKKSRGSSRLTSIR